MDLWRILVENPKAQKLNRKTFMFNKTVREPQAVGKIKGLIGCDGASWVLLNLAVIFLSFGVE